MKKTENHVNGRGISEVFLCDLIPTSLLDGHDRCEKMGQRLIGAAASLPENAFIGLRFTYGADGETVLHAFASESAGVCAEDYPWLFEGCAEIKAAPAEQPLTELFPERTELYMLLPSQEYDGKNPFGSENLPFHDLAAALKESGAILNLNIFSNLDASVIIALKAEMRIKLKASLALALPGVRAVKVGAEEANARLCGELSAESAAGCLSGLALMRMSDLRFKALKEQEKRLGLPGKDDPSFDPDDDLDYWAFDLDELPNDAEADKPQTPLAKLGLGIRCFNSLMRAGYLSVEAVLAANRDELRKVRNLGRVCYEELIKKLDEWKAKEKARLQMTSPTHTLAELIGLGEVKRQVRMIEAYARMKRDMENKGMNSASLVLNMQFIGNPGTAKTTVARIIAGIFHEAGLLKSPVPVEVGRSKLVGQYVGETARNVSAVFEEADGRLLFIDEAYSLVDDRRGLYGDEAINTIVQEMENRRDRTIVIFAGYPAEMEGFIENNPGLRSRVPFTISFKDYSAEELLAICELEAKRRSFAIAESAKERLLSICAKAAASPTAGNGRFCRNLVESAMLRYAETHYSADAEDTADGAEESGEFELEAAHFETPELLLEGRKSDKNKIGFAS